MSAAGAATRATPTHPAPYPSINSTPPMSPILFDPSAPDPVLLAHEAGGDRLLTAARRGVIVFVRQSTPMQRDNNLGSGIVQQSLKDMLIQRGVPAEDITILDARSESAKGPIVTRPKFAQMLQAIRAGKVGVIAVSKADRIARNEEVARALTAELKSAKALLYVDGNVYDPRNMRDTMVLSLLSAIAVQENQQRARVSAESRSALAQRCQAGVRLPIGLVWADPTSRDYRDAMHRAGLEEYLTTWPDRHAAFWQRRDRKLYIMPHPDRDVFDATRLRQQWMVETANASLVLRRILDPESGWPTNRTGQIPGDHGWVWHRDMRSTWRRLESRATRLMSDEISTIRTRSVVPALFGIYFFQPTSLRSTLEVRADLKKIVWRPDAFPRYFDFGEKELRALVDRIGLRTKDWKRGSYEGPRNAILRNLRCGHVGVDGRLCRRQLPATYRGGKGGRYQYKACVHDGHARVIPAQADNVVLRAVESLFAGESLRETLDWIQSSPNGDALELRRLRREVEQLQREREYAMREQMQRGIDAHALEGDSARRQEYEALRSGESVWRTKVGDAGRRLAAAQSELTAFETRSEAEGSLTREEVNRVFAMAADIPQLLRRTQETPAILSDVVRTLVPEILVRSVGRFCHELVLRFPTGYEHAMPLVRPRTPPQPQAAVAFAAVGQWLNLESRDRAGDEATRAAEAVAHELSRFKTRNRPGEKAGVARWTPADVWGAAYWYQHVGSGLSSMITTEFKTLHELAERAGVSQSRIARAALEGRLGPARVAGAELTLSPTEADLAQLGPDVGHRLLAEKLQCSPTSIVQLADVRRATGLTWAEFTSVFPKRIKILTDAAGRRYVWEKNVPSEEDILRLRRPRVRPRADADHLAEALRNAPSELRELDRSQWVRLAEAKRRLPGVHPITMRRHLRFVESGGAYSRDRAVFFWLSAEEEARLHAPQLAEVAATLEPPRIPDDFVPREAAQSLVRKVLGVTWRGTGKEGWTNAVRQGRILEVRAATPERPSRPVAHVFMPRPLRENPTVDGVKKWWEGC